MVALRPETELRVSPVVRPLFFTAWLMDAADRLRRNRADLEDGAVGRDPSRHYLRDRTIDIAVRKRALLHRGRNSLAVSGCAVDIDEAWLNDRSPVVATVPLPPETMSASST